MDDIEDGTFGILPAPSQPPEGRHTLPFFRYVGDGIPLRIPPPARNAEQPSPHRSVRDDAKRAQEPGIPANVDILQWYAAYLKLDTMRHSDGHPPMAKEDKRELYRDITIAVYHASGYSIGESVDKAYSPQGDELMRYLSDDKRHPLNRDSEMEVDE